MSSTPRFLILLLLPSLSLLACGEGLSPSDGSGGAAAGGAVGSGGAASGGASSGGAAASGGAPSGGASSGGASSGGAASGGASSGGAASGGTNSGGESNSGGSASGGGDGSGGAESGEFLLSGPAWEGVNNEDCTAAATTTCETYPLESTNFGSPQKNVSPEMSWSGVPDGTMSFALVLSDLSNGMAHWVMYDIPANVTMLEKGLPSGSPLTEPAGAKQAGFGNPPAYFGSGACGNVYEHRLYALGVAALNPSGTSAGMVRTAVQNSDILGETFIRLQSRDCN